MAKNRQARKAQRTRGQPERQEGPEHAAPLTGPFLSHAGIIVQSFAVFVALSILLGRIYSQRYLETLGIPSSEVRLNVTDYAVISPEVTVFGVGVATILAVLLLSDTASMLNAVSRWWLFSLALGLLIVGVFLAVYTVGLSSLQPGLNSVTFLVQMLLSLALMTFAGSVLGSLLASFVPEHTQKSPVWKAVTPLLVLIFIGYSVVASSRFASDIGVAEALNTLALAPLAEIRLTPSSSDHAMQFDSNECDGESLRCRFRVILIGDKFVYLRPLNPKSPQEHLYAIPIGDVGSITYLFEEIVPDENKED